MSHPNSKNPQTEKKSRVSSGKSYYIAMFGIMTAFGLLLGNIGYQDLRDTQDNKTSEISSLTKKFTDTVLNKRILKRAAIQMEDKEKGVITVEFDRNAPSVQKQAKEKALEAFSDMEKDKKISVIAAALWAFGGFSGLWLTFVSGNKREDDLLPKIKDETMPKMPKVRPPKNDPTNKP